MIGSAESCAMPAPESVAAIAAALSVVVSYFNIFPPVVISVDVHIDYTGNPAGGHFLTVNKVAHESMILATVILDALGSGRNSAERSRDRYDSERLMQSSDGRETLS